jgi:hypothetical protein
MYYVRNRFLLPQVGTWNRRDPLGYVDGMALNSYCFSNAPVLIDPFGVDSWLNPWPWLCKAQEAVCGIYSVGPVDAWNAGIGWISDAAFEFQEIGKTGGEKNALRHCLWQALLCIENGRDCAESIGDAHERGRTGTNDSRADQHNNIEGRWCCSDAIKLHLEHRKKSHPTTTETVDTKREWDFVIPLAKQCCLRKFRDGTLIIDPDNDHRSNRHRGLGAGGLGSGSESGTSAANGSTSS